MTHLTAIVLTYNEAEQIADCIKTLRFADRVIVFDSYSDDETVAVAQRAGADIFQHEFVNYAEQRNAALDAADERRTGCSSSTPTSASPMLWPRRFV